MRIRHTRVTGNSPQVSEKPAARGLELRVHFRLPMRKHFAVLAFISLGASSAFAQLVSFGVKGGVPLIDQTVNSVDQSRPYIVGPSVEFRLPANFAIEVDALYQRIGQSVQFSEISAGVSQVSLSSVSLSQQLRANDWTFPVLGKYYFRPRSTSWSPYIATGWALRVLDVQNKGSETIMNSAGAPQTLPFNGHFHSDDGVGAVAAAGVRFKRGRLAISPEIRYTRWGSSTGWVNKNEAGFLLGISF